MAVFAILGMLPELLMVLLGYGAGKKSECACMNAAMPFTQLFGQWFESCSISMQDCPGGGASLYMGVLC